MWVTSRIIFLSSWFDLILLWGSGENLLFLDRRISLHCGQKTTAFEAVKMWPVCPAALWPLSTKMKCYRILKGFGHHVKTPSMTVCCVASHSYRDKLRAGLFVGFWFLQLLTNRKILIEKELSAIQTLSQKTHKKEYILSSLSVIFAISSNKLLYVMVSVLQGSNRGLLPWSWVLDDKIKQWVQCDYSHFIEMETKIQANNFWTWI